MILRPSIEEYFIKMAELVATRSTCTRRSVGAVVTDKQGRVLGTGYNGVARKQEHCTWQTPCPGALDERGDTSRCVAIHAETNALIWATDKRYMHTLYCTNFPCQNCCKLIIATSIKRVIFKLDYADMTGKNLLRCAGVIMLQAKAPDGKFYLLRIAEDGN